MDAERLHNILHIIKNDFDSRSIISLAQNFVNTFTQNIQQPAPQHSQDFNDAKEKFKIALSECDSNNFLISTKVQLNAAIFQVEARL